MNLSKSKSILARLQVSDSQEVAPSRKPVAGRLGDEEHVALGDGQTVTAI
jgi:hypothetical protein